MTLKNKAINLGGSIILVVGLIFLIRAPIGPLAGGLQIIAPTDGIFDNDVTQPDTQTIIIPGLDTDTIVVQDEYGIPHIYAESRAHPYDSRLNV